MPLEAHVPAELPQSRLAWRLAGPSVVVSLVVLIAAGLAAKSLFDAQRKADDVLREVVDADNYYGEVVLLLTKIRAQLLRHAFAGLSTDLETLADLRSNLHEIVESSRHDQSPDIDQVRDDLQLLDEELAELILNPDPLQRRETANRIVSGILAPDLLSIAERDSRLARRALVDAQTRSRELTKWTGWIILIFGVAGAAAGVLAGFGIARTLRQRLVELRVPIQTAAGSLDAVVGPVEVRSGADVEDIEESLNSLASRVSDVVQRLQSAERESLRNDQLASLGQLAAGLAHELRNPLTAIRTLVEAARTGGPAAQLDGRDLEVVDEELTRLDSTLQSFLDYARPPKLQRRAIDLRDVVDRTALLVKPRAEQQSVRLHVAEPATPVRVNADPEQLRQVVLNLLLNALDALGSGGQIEVAAEEHTAQKKVTLTIADNGPGITASIRDKLFEPFVSSKASGTGLGLTICRRIVENHGGTITVENRPTGGAIFTIQLPAEAPLAVPSTVPSALPTATTTTPALASP